MKHFAAEVAPNFASEGKPAIADLLEFLLDKILSHI
jgi:hypothetical protein